MAKKDIEFTIRAKDAASAALKKVENATGNTIQKLFGFKAVLGTLSGALSGLALGVVIKDIIDLGVASDKTFRQIAAALPTGVEGIGQLKHAIKDLAIESGRSLTDMQAAAAEIAHLGVSNASEVSSRLRIASELADVTGGDIKGIIEGMDQVMDLFGLSAEQAGEEFKKLISANRGRGDIEAIFQAYKSGSRNLKELGIDATTATKALTALLDAGIDAGQINTILLQHTPEQIRRYADSVQIATDYTKDFNDQLEIVRGGADRAAQRLKTEFSSVLQDLGEHALPLVNGALEVMDFWLKAITNTASKLDLKSFIAQAKEAGALAANGHLRIAPGSREAIGLGSSLSNLNAAARKGQVSAADFSAKDAALIRQAIEENIRLTEEYWTKIHNGAAMSAASVQGLRDQYKDLAKVLDEASRKADGMSGRKTGASGGGLKLGPKIADTKAAEAAAAQAARDAAAALERQQKQAQDAADAVAQLDAAYTRLSGDALAQFDAEVQAVFDRLEKSQENVTGHQDEFAAKTAQLKAVYADLRAAVVDTINTEQDLNVDLANFNGDSVESFLDDWIAKAAEVKTKMDAAQDPAVAAQYKKELDQINDAIEKASGMVPQMAPPPDHAKHVRELADQWVLVGRSIIAAAQAVGGLDDKTASALQNMANLGEGITRLFSGDVVGGTVETITSIAALGKSLFGGESTAEKRQRAEAQASIAQMLTGLSQQIHGGGSLADQITNAQQQFTSSRFQIEDQLAGKKNESAREDALRQLDKLEAERIAQLKEEFAEQQKQLQEDYHIRLLRAEGFNTEADAEELAEQQQREYEQAVKDGADATTLAALSAAQNAEAQKAMADAERKAAEDAYNKGQTDANQEIQINNIDDPLEQFKIKAKEAVKAGGDFGKIFEGYDLDNLTPEQVAEINEKIKAFFHTIKESPDAIDTAGLSVDDLTDACLEFSDAADAVADSVQSAADAFNEATQQLSIHERIFGTNPVQHAKDVAAAGNVDLSGFDLSTQAGHDAALAYLEDLYNQHPELGEIYASIADAINAVPIIDATSGTSGFASIPGALSSGSDSFAKASVGSVMSISAAQAGGMLARIDTSNDYLRAIKENTDHMTVFGGAGAGAAGPVVLNFYIDEQQVGQLLRDYDAPSLQQLFDRANGKGLTRTRASAGLPRT